MARTKIGSTWAVLAFLAVTGAAVYTCDDDDDALSSDKIKHLANQVWLERLPENDRDQIHHVVFIDQRRDRFGAFGRSSTWRHAIEVFRWNREDDRLTLLLPQDRVRLDLNVRVWHCEGEAPEPFELCLELTTPSGRTGHYFSRYDWKIDAEDGSLPDVAALAGIELPAAPAAVEAADFVATDAVAPLID